MHVLVLGGGGREHALVKAIKLSPKVKHVSCAPGNPGITQDATCYLTDPTDSRRVVELAKRIKPDLIVMGTHGRTGLGRLLMGSAAEQVMRNALCPVLTVRTPFVEHATVGANTEAQEAAFSI